MSENVAEHHAVLEGLNPEQRRAVTTTEGPLLVVAGAGSGKTRVLTHRIAYLVGACGIPPEQILAVTFTNKAAREMRERVTKLLGPDADGSWISTFHSTGVRILRREIGHLGRSRGFVIYDESDSLGVLKEALRRHGLDTKGQEAKRLRWRIDEWKNAGLLPNHAAAAAADIEAQHSAEIYATYQRLLADANALDFGDLLLLNAQLFRDHPQVLRHYQERWAYVLIDEYQDTNRVQYEWVNALASGHRNLCVVGDPDQSVYAWRGADIRNILDFERDYPDAATVVLDRNYRSTQPILSGAGAVVSNNTGRPEKEMRAERGPGEPIRFYHAEDEREESAHVVSGILERARGEGRPLSHFAIFYRTNAQSRPLEEELLKYDVPYVVVGGIRFYDRAEIKDALGYLRLLINPADDMALRRIVNSPPRGIGKTTLERAAEVALRDGVPLLAGLERYGAQAQRGGEKIRAFLRLLAELRDEVASAGPADAISLVLDRSGYLRHLEAARTPEAEARVENLRELVVGAEDFEVSNAEDGDDRSHLELFLDQVALVTDLDNVDERTDRVSLMTAHSAKGLEFPVVYLVGMEEGLFPHSASARDAEAVEEER
ncbi:MAG: UvrD-helicase domain-containing protein, partial [Myxococcales bacterium]|nr:UvrD-helicase domain-containing protein [Myxococcales bacterium]